MNIGLNLFTLVQKIVCNCCKGKRCKRLQINYNRLVEDHRNKVNIAIEHLDFFSQDQSVEESNSVCKECEEKIENAFDFKSCLVNTESCLVPYVSEDKTQKVNLRIIVEKDSPSTNTGECSAEKEVCRLCKNFVDTISVISLPKILKDDGMMEIFQVHIPEMVSFILEYLIFFRFHSNKRRVILIM